MKKFSMQVDKRSRSAMTNYLREHFRYNTMNSWNGSTSYANNLKITSLGLPSSVVGKLLDMCQMESFFWPIEDLIRGFAEEYNYSWQAGFNGRSGGYLVLYEGGNRESAYKSYCQVCGQRNYTSVSKTGTKCGCCGSDNRVDYTVPPVEHEIYVGRSIDQWEDFEDWEMSQLRDRVELIQSFDRLCDEIVRVAIDTAQNNNVEEYEIMVPVTKKRLIAV